MVTPAQQRRCAWMERLQLMLHTRFKMSRDLNIFTITNTGSAHTEYLLLTTEASYDRNRRIICSTSAPTASQLLIGTVTVNADGTIAAYVDNQNNVLGPSIGSTRVKMLGSAQPTCSSTRSEEHTSELQSLRH